MTVAVDVDDVLLSLADSWLALYNEDFADNLTKEDWKSWDIHLYTKPECGLKFYEYLNTPGLYAKVQPIPGAFEGVCMLRSMGHRVVFVTATNVEQNGAKLLRLAELGFLTLTRGYCEDYIETQSKDLVRADVLIDDKEMNLNAFIGRGILYTQPHNLTSTYFPRANNWPEVVSLVKLMTSSFCYN